MVHKQLPSLRPRPVFEREAGDFVENRELKTAADAELKDVPGRRVIEISYLLKFIETYLNISASFPRWNFYD